MLAVKRRPLVYDFIIRKCPCEVIQMVSGALGHEKKQWEVLKVKNEN